MMPTAVDFNEQMDGQWGALSRQVRASMGLGRERFARLLKVSARTVMRWENGLGEEPVVPQGVQRVKLLALGLGDGIGHEQALLGDLLDQAAEMRSGYEARATTIRRYEVELEAEPPAWFDDLVALKRERNWDALLRLGPHFLPAEGRGELAAETEALVCLWIGLAAFMKGFPPKAVEFYDRALGHGEVVAPLVRCVLLANKGYALIRLHRHAAADEALAACLGLDPAHRGALRNRLVLAAQGGDEAAFLDAATALRRHHPAADDPASELGEALREDPDLAPMRGRDVFARALPGLVESSEGRSPR